MFQRDISGQNVIAGVYFMDCPTFGKRQINRRKVADEELVVHSQGKSYVRRKGQVKMTCSTCGAIGHNKRYHDRPDAPNADDWFNTKLEPVDEYANAAGNEQENMVGKRVPQRKVSSTAHNPVEGQQFQFMPTPMSLREMQTDYATSGPVATLPSVNIPTTEVNFEVMVDELQSVNAAEASRLMADWARKRRNVNISMATS